LPAKSVQGSQAHLRQINDSQITACRTQPSVFLLKPQSQFFCCLPCEGCQYDGLRRHATHTQQKEDAQNKGIGFAHTRTCNDLERTISMVHDRKLSRIGRSSCCTGDPSLKEFFTSHTFPFSIQCLGTSAEWLRV